MDEVIPLDGLQAIPPCEPKMDELTHVLLLGLLTSLVQMRDQEADPVRHADLASVTSSLGSIIARHEPQEEA
ncbi:hypothetical protein [Pseudomonas oryzihabitans]|uniref:hypothetical protein n=1 Tax=Pseudomonas oryzihabitans TaxID=47885 RepID=UPI0011A3F7AE|nr:hypothetical protein [Pseudomonas psychrotolerans]